MGLVLLAVNLALAELVVARLEDRKPHPRTLLAGGITLALACLYGVLRIRTVDAMVQAAEEAKVGVVQANMGLIEKRNSFDEGLRRHFDLSRQLETEDHADFLVWSETSATRPVREETYPQELRGTVTRRIGAPAIFGAVMIKLVPDERGYVAYNTAVSSDETGVVNARYTKQYLLMFGEYLPFGETFPILYKWSPNRVNFSPGESLEPLFIDLHGERHPVTTLICYEDILPGFTNAAVRHADPQLLVNMTNDAWFGDTAEPWEHLALAQLRAIEHRRYLVRGTNSGVSAVVDPVGRVVAHTGTFKEEKLAATIHWLQPHTVYERLGDWPWVLASLAMAVGAFRKRVLPVETTTSSASS